MTSSSFYIFAFIRKTSKAVSKHIDAKCKAFSLKLVSK